MKIQTVLFALCMMVVGSDVAAMSADPEPINYNIRQAEAVITNTYVNNQGNPVLSIELKKGIQSQTVYFVCAKGSSDYTVIYDFTDINNQATDYATGFAIQYYPKGQGNKARLVYDDWDNNLVLSDRRNATFTQAMERASKLKGGSIVFAFYSTDNYVQGTPVAYSWSMPVEDFVKNVNGVVKGEDFDGACDHAFVQGYAPSVGYQMPRMR